MGRRMLASGPLGASAGRNALPARRTIQPGGVLLAQTFDGYNRGAHENTENGQRRAESGFIRYFIRLFLFSTSLYALPSSIFAPLALRSRLQTSVPSCGNTRCRTDKGQWSEGRMPRGLATKDRSGRATMPSGNRQ
jgi:hypothetical protein